MSTARENNRAFEETVAARLGNERLLARLKACYYEALERVPSMPGSASLAGVTELEWIEKHLGAKEES